MTPSERIDDINREIAQLEAQRDATTSASEQGRIDARIASLEQELQTLENRQNNQS
jgi:hypothetical protein